MKEIIKEWYRSWGEFKYTNYPDERWYEISFLHIIAATLFLPFHLLFIVLENLNFKIKIK